MTKSQRVATAVTAAVLLLEVGTMVASTFVDRWIDDLGYGDQVDSIPPEWVWLACGAVLAPGVVGLAIVRTHPRHAVGWLFTGLSFALILSLAFDQWFALAAIVEPPKVGGAGAAALLADKVFFPWWPLLTLILLLTPTGTYLSPRWRTVGRVSVVATLVSFGLSVTGNGELNAPYNRVDNPLTIDAIGGPARVGGLLAFLVVAGCLIASGASMVLRWRRAEGDARRQLLWLSFAAALLPAVIPVHLYAVVNDDNALILITVGLFLVLIPVTAGLSVLRYRLYDVDRIVSTTTTYSVLSVLLAAVYAGIVWIGSRVSWDTAPSPATTAAVGAVTSALLFAPLRTAVQQRVDRRFNRRAYDAGRVVRRALAEDRAGLDPEAVLRVALADPSVSVSYPGIDGPVDGSGALAGSEPHQVEVVRRGRTVAWIGFDPLRTDEATVTRASALVAAELDNTRLRAELQRNLAELTESRSRIADAQRQERKRIERDLHDGAQQTLLALAFDLQSAQLNGDADRMHHALVAGATSARDAARELRDLANGLHPQALVEGGLAAVLDDVARHSPVPVQVNAPSGRWEPAVEFTAWLVVAEAVVNAQKHAEAARIDVDVRQDGGHLLLRVADDGRGGADQSSSGLRGLRDRVEASGGTVTISSDPGIGTTLEAVIPCAS
ncbi:sensor histidine kinase [Nocardioides humilatus]|nr:sensor histidine kinase [Nocardioides humilatus]